MDKDHDDNDVWYEAQYACFQVARLSGASLETLQAIFDLKPLSKLTYPWGERSSYDRLHQRDIELVGGVYIPEPKPKSVRFPA